jgi:ribosomal protein L33
MAKANTIKVIMRSTESPFFYVTRKNKANKEKLLMKSYDPSKGVRKHVDFKEEKVK